MKIFFIKINYINFYLNHFIPIKKRYSIKKIKMVIQFTISLSIGKNYSITTKENNTFLYVFNKYVKNNCPSNSEILTVLKEGQKVDINKTLIENKITQGCTVLVMLKLDSESVSTGYESENYQNTTTSNIMPTPPKIEISPQTPLIMNPNFIPFIPNFNVQSPNIIQPNMILPLPNPPIIPIPGIIHDYVNPKFQIYINFLINECKVPSILLDYNFNCDNEWTDGRKNGPPGFLKDYFPPHGWIGIGLKVLNLYDNGDNTWIGNYNQIGEWYIAYHPIKTINSILGILNKGFRKGPYQDCKNDVNINPLTKNSYPYCGEGVYFIPDINEAKKYTEIFEYLGNKFRIAFMCRINPLKVRIADIGMNDESWIVNGDGLHDINGRKRDDEVRPYRILFFLEK